MSNEYTARRKWHITTEGDVEGKTITDLGVYEGYLDEIAFRLGSRSYYSLRFSPWKEIPEPPLEKALSSISVSVDIDSGTWDMSPEQRVAWFRNLLRGRNVGVEAGQSYASVILQADQGKAQEIARARALAKLDDNDKKALGIQQ